jgi:hypothetical protein
VLSYAESTGEFRWLKSSVSTPCGTVAGCLALGYVQIKIDKKLYKAHRLAWLYMTGSWPIDQIDHINGKKADNRWCNLRDVSRTVNMQNQKTAMASSSTGVLGVSPFSRNRFRADIWVNGEHKYLGSFKTIEEASIAYISAKRTQHEGNTL